jgi:hypothetical protein
MWVRNGQARTVSFTLLSKGGLDTEARSAPILLPLLYSAVDDWANGRNLRTAGKEKSDQSGDGALLASVRNTCSGTQHQTSLNDFCHTVTQAWSDPQGPPVPSRLRVAGPRRAVQTSF